MAVTEPVLDDHTMKFGLLMESAQTHQRLAESHLERLRAHTRDLDGVVRDEIRRTLIDELRAVTAESDRAVRALREVKHAVRMRTLAWNLGVMALCTAAPAAIAHFVLPSQTQIDQLRSRRDVLEQNVLSLERRGGRVDWRLCGEAAQLCVRVDRKTQVYGVSADYFVLKGY